MIQRLVKVTRRSILGSDGMMTNRMTEDLATVPRRRSAEPLVLQPACCSRTKNARGYVIPLACLPAPQAASTAAHFHASFATVHVDESPGPECRWTGTVLAPVCSESDSILDVHLMRTP